MAASAIDQAQALEAAGRHEAAAAVCETILDGSPDSIDARCLLARLAIRRRDFGVAEIVLRQSLCLDPRNVLAWYLRAIATSERGDATGAAAPWQRTAILAPPESEPGRQAAELSQVFAWLVPATLPPSGSACAPAIHPPTRWLFVWRELDELLRHFREATIGQAETLALTRERAGGRSSACTAEVAHRLLERCRAACPDIVVAMPGLNPYLNPNVCAFELLRANGVPTVLMLPDLRKGIWQRLATAAAPHFDLVVSLDGCALEELEALMLPAYRYMRGWTPIHPPAWTVPFDARFIAVNMVGTLWGERRRAADILMAAGIDVLTRERLTEGEAAFDATTARRAIPAEVYMERMRHSKIAVNFSACQTGEGHQLKGRVLEAAATGTLILESANDVTSKFFVPDREYVAFSDLGDLTTKVAYFLSHPDEAAAIGARAREKVLTSYGAERFWREVAARAFAVSRR